MGAFARSVRHVPNLQPPNEPWGISDLRDVVGLNRPLNERVSDQADTVRYHADPPVIFKGIAEHTDLAVWSTQEPDGPSLIAHWSAYSTCRGAQGKSGSAVQS